MGLFLYRGRLGDDVFWFQMAHPLRILEIINHVIFHALIVDEE